MSGDLTEPELRRALADRPLRCYPALLSTEAEAMAWARAGGPAGGVVVAGYQASPRGRAGLPWQTELGAGLGFSLLLRPSLPVEREGWPYLAASTGLAEGLLRARGQQVRLEWPDTVVDTGSGDRAAAVGVRAELGPDGIVWVVVSVLVESAPPPRGPLLAVLAGAIESCMEAAEVPPGYLERCLTLGRRVRARLIPMGPGGPEVTGRAVGVRADGALLLVTDPGARVAVRPHHLGLLEPAGPPDPDAPAPDPDWLLAEPEPPAPDPEAT